jgi:two-component system chemotaxis response regulator CheY
MSRTILVVDDAAFMRMLLREILVAEGYVVHEAVNGRDAVEKFSEVRPDLVTMDVTMPEMDGITALVRIRETDPAARVVMVTAQSAQGAINRTFDAGALDFITKPFQPAKLVETVRKCLATAPDQ